MVRLVGQAAAPGEDRLLLVAGFSAPDVGAQVSAGHGQEPGYPAWALLNDPHNAAVALEAVAEMERAQRMLRSKPGPGLDLYQEISRRLPAAHHPAYWEQVGRACIAAGRHKQGSLMFGRARQADEHAGVVDRERRRAMFLEFALAGALSVKDIKKYVAELVRGGDPVGSYHELRELAVRRTLGGLPPWPDMLKQLAKLAKLADLDVAAEHARVLEALVEAPALWRASDGFWTSQRKTWLAAVAASPPTVSRRVLWRLPELPDKDMDAWWVALLEEAGAFDELEEDTGAWLTAMLRRYSGEGRLAPGAPRELLDLLPRLAGRIDVAGDALDLGGGTAEEYRVDAAVVGGCLAAGIPVADPDPNLLLAHWSEHDRVDVEALTGDDRFAEPLARSILVDARGRNSRWRREWEIEPLRPLLRAIVESTLRQAIHGGVQDALDALDWLYQTQGKGSVAHVPDLLGRLSEIDLVVPLTRTLRAGILDELGWDDLDEAALRLKEDYNWCRPSWPVLTVHDRHKAIAIGPKGRLLEHRLTVPKGANRFSCDVRVFFCEGEFLVYHVVNRTRTLYWSGAADQIVSETDDSLWHYGERRRKTGYTFLGPHGLRFMGHRLLARGEQRVSPDGHMFHDGDGFWWTADIGGKPRVHPIDLVAEELGEPDWPEFLDPSLLEKDEVWLVDCSSLAPAAEGTSASPLGTDGSHLGFRVARDRVTGRVRYHRVDGVQGAAPVGVSDPWGLLDVPGAERRLLLEGGYDVTARDPETGEAYWRVYMMDQDWIVNRPSDMSAGTRRMPPKAFWHFLEPRDLPGSRALRAISRDTVRGLLDAAATSEPTLRKAVASLLPEVTHPLLVEGIVGVVGEAARRIPDRDRLLKVLGHRSPRPLKVSEPDLEGALEGMVSRYHEGNREMVRQIELASAFLDGAIDVQTAMAYWGVEQSQYDWTELVGRIGGLAVRTVSAVTPAEHRAALTTLLRFWSSSPLIDPTLRRGLLDQESPEAWSGEKGRLLPLNIAMHMGSWARSHDAHNHTTKAFLQRGEVPRPEGFVDIEPPVRGWATGRRLRVLLEELDRRGPVPFVPDAAERLAKATGLERAEAALLLTGLPGVNTRGSAAHECLPYRVRAALGLKEKEANAAHDGWWRMPTVTRLELYDAAMPNHPDQLWDQHAMADRLARAWQRLDS